MLGSNTEIPAWIIVWLSRVPYEVYSVWMVPYELYHSLWEEELVTSERC